MRSFTTFVRTALAIALVSACGGDAVTGSTGSPPVTVPPRDTTPAPPPPSTTPGPVGPLTPVVDRARAASDSIPLSGGTLVATGADGTTYRLTIPATALLRPVRITMTPITDVTGFTARGGRWLGVDLQPHGLRFASPLTLDVVPAGGTGAVRAQTFAYGADGADFHRFPLVADRTRLRMQLLHFSGALAYVGDGISIPVLPGPPADAEAQLEQAVAELVNAERDAQLTGRPGDPDFVAKLEQLHAAYFDAVVQPILTRMVSDCKFAEQNTSKALGWARSVELLFPDRFGRQTGAVTDAMLRATQHCLEEAIAPCIDWGDPAQVQRVLAYDRQRELLGMEGPPNIYDSALACGDLEGTFTAEMSEGGLREVVRATVKFALDRGASGPGGRSYVVRSGQVTWSGELSVPGCRATVQGVSAPVRAGDGTVSILRVGTAQLYFGRGISQLPNASVIVDCPDQPTQTAPYPVGARAWLSIPYPPGGVLGDGDRTMVGSFADGRTTWRWSMRLTSGVAGP
ncbi:hypothetical protein [Roseisolibacter agri]|uniref:Uncharacterized protein n=1 Tax=Roseisolibacter agri TaxID=2014610 RepID=A0AA37QEN1_9BACT|nr:hypothetical protein [Roseisolibacter agri]GLC24930.1 hypothetical protein rosag_14430 [Roseisolibacter agri]